MEVLINSSVFLCTLLIIILVEKVIYAKAISTQEIAERQKTLDEIERNVKIQYNLDWKRDAKTEIIRDRKKAKALALFFSAIGILFVAYPLAVFRLCPSSTVGCLCLSAVIVIVYAAVKMAKSEK
jgi:hypothetical protein